MRISPTISTGLTECLNGKEERAALSTLMKVARTALELFLSFTSIALITAFLQIEATKFQVMCVSGFVVFIYPEFAYILSAFGLALMAINGLPALFASPTVIIHLPPPPQILAPVVPSFPYLGPGLVV